MRSQGTVLRSKPSFASPSVAIHRLQTIHRVFVDAQYSKNDSHARKHVILHAGKPSKGGKNGSAATLSPSSSSSSSSSSASAMCIVDNLRKTHDGERTLFDRVSFNIARGERIAVVGANGTGKSTLLRILAGEDSPTSGGVTLRRNTLLTHVPQEPTLPPDDSIVLDALLSLGGATKPIAKAAVKYHAAQSSTDTSAAATTALLEATAALDTLDAWDVVIRATDLAHGCGLSDALLSSTLASLSGGQRRRVALCGALLRQPDVLLLDEPTNHLDSTTIEWLTNRLTGRTSGGDPSFPGTTTLSSSSPSTSNSAAPQTTFFVTHDRCFMENVATSILELDDGSAYLHRVTGPGCYDTVREQRAARRHAQAKAASNARTILRKEAEWMRRQPKARQAKSFAREQRYYRLTDAARNTPQAETRVQLAVTQTGKTGGTSGVPSWAQRSSYTPRLGNEVLRIEDASFEWRGIPLFRSLTYAFQPGERVGIVGRNGVGKTTLLDVLTGHCPLSGGKRILGETTRVGYFTQHPPEVPKEERLIEYVRNVAAKDGMGAPSSAAGKAAAEAALSMASVDDEPVVVRAASARDLAAARDARTYGGGGDGASSSSSSSSSDPFAAQMTPERVLERFGFSRARQYQRVGTLSGGERRRLHLATILLTRPNLLLLDEPTNDLDLTTIEALEEYLQDEQAFPGTVIVVSHDKAFMRNVVDKLFILEGDGTGGVTMYDGSFTEYEEDMAMEREDKGNMEEDKGKVEEERGKAVGSLANTPTKIPPRLDASPVVVGETAAAVSPRPVSSPTVAATPAAPPLKKLLKLNSKEKMEYSTIEGEIEALQAKAAKLEVELQKASTANDLTKVQSLSKEIAVIGETIVKKEERWLSLAERADL